LPDKSQEKQNAFYDNCYILCLSWIENYLFGIVCFRLILESQDLPDGVAATERILGNETTYTFAC